MRPFDKLRVTGFVCLVMLTIGSISFEIPRYLGMNCVYFLFHINCLFLAVSLWLLAYKINKNGAKSQALSTVCELNSLFLNQFFGRNAFAVCFQRNDISARYKTVTVYAFIPKDHRTISIMPIAQKSNLVVFVIVDKIFVRKHN